VGQVLTLAVPINQGAGDLKDGRLRHYAGPDVYLDCLLKDAVHGVCSFHWWADTLAAVYSLRINIQPLRFFSDMTSYAPTTRLMAPDQRRFCHVLLVLEESSTVKFHDAGCHVKRVNIGNNNLVMFSRTRTVGSTLRVLPRRHVGDVISLECF